jgi:hypothetical protein
MRMQRFLMGLLAAGLVLVNSAPSQANWRNRGCDSCCYSSCGSPCCQTEVVWVKRTITTCEAQWEEKEVTYNVCKMVPEVVERKCNVMVPDYHDEQRTITCYKYVPQEVVRDVVVCRSVPVTVTDCCGCCHTCWQTVQEKAQVKCCVMQCVAEQKPITVRVCSYHSEERSYKVTVCRQVVEPVTAKVRVCKMVPVQREVMVAECHPVCATSCYNGCGGCGH